MKLIAYDLGTGGVKASLYDEQMNTLSKTFIEYETQYPKSYLHEQRPADWWNGVMESTRALLSSSRTAPREIGCLALSGHSLVAVPLDREGRLLKTQVPIWSDTRAEEEAEEFFTRIDRDEWYMTTGNGFPAPCYSLFKLMWLKKHDPDTFAKTHTVLGSKDYINYMLTGSIAIDHSYASGTGAYSLKDKKMCAEFLDAAGIPASFFPEIVPSHQIIGSITQDAAAKIGLPAGTPVACGGVDNACMALGALGPQDGKIYCSLGSSSWVPVNSRTPVLDPVKKPYVFAHIEENMFTSAFSIFAGGSSFRWAKEVLCKDIEKEPGAYDLMSRMAASSPIGAGGVFFNPSLAGGTSQDKSIHIRGGYLGLSLGTRREDMVRAAMEGIALNLHTSVSYLQAHTKASPQILFCGGGSKSKFWMQMFADVFDMEVIKTNIDQDAASLGAAAIAARAVGLWKDYTAIPSLHVVETRSKPDPKAHAAYARLQPVFDHISSLLADVGDLMMKQTQNFESKENIV